LKKYSFSIVAMLFALCGGIAEPSSSSEAKTENRETKPMEGDREKVKESLRKLIEEYGYGPEDRCVVVVISSQRLYLLEGSQVQRVYAVSTSKFGVGNEANSNKTPLGVHRIEERYGDGARLGAIFRARALTGEIAEIRTDPGLDIEEDLITTRILRLRGLEPGKNSGAGIDSYDRMIYIHGTPEEGLIGKPASHGCVRMKNRDVVEVYNSLQEGCLVEMCQ